MKRKLSIFIFLLALSITSVIAQSNPKADGSLAKVPDTGCTGQDTYDQGVKIVPNANSWTDSYQANDLCFCKSSFDHGVGNFKITINGQGRNIKDICDELKKHPKFRNIRNGDPRYNTIQCGNEPGHGDAITIQGKRIKDEKVCPGRVDQGSKGCKCKGPGYDMAWLRTRARFGGNGGGNNGGGNNSGGSVTFKGQSINKYLSTNMNFNSGSAGNQQKFSVQSAGNGTVSIKASNGKYVSSENGNKRMTANRNAVGAWEKFTLVSQGGDVYAIRGNNGKYVSHENGNGAANCNRGAIGAWEKFVIKGLSSSRIATSKSGDLLSTNINVYPNPSTLSNVNLQIDTQNKVSSTLEIMDLNGRSIAKKDLGILRSGANTISLNEFSNVVGSAGLYLVKVKVGNKTVVKQMILK
ncbi:T9SS type A sorting domain-containing protein [Aquimarina aggregata]|uniref:T9SS type A sorting domain-containing protein n=1 Tax=Aquimarina aggregata TaxID=1642818 RepID=UPI002491B27C|nr:T9SS type A sorting domain-containing protein [Aquimarina aggregata]